jgi:hypothetical protein
VNCSGIFVADENIPIFVVKQLRQKGCKIVSITEEAKGYSDETGLDISIKHRAVLISFD